VLRPSLQTGGESFCRLGRLGTAGDGKSSEEIIAVRRPAAVWFGVDVAAKEAAT